MHEGVWLSHLKEYEEEEEGEGGFDSSVPSLQAGVIQQRADSAGFFSPGGKKGRWELLGHLSQNIEASSR